MRRGLQHARYVIYLLRFLMLPNYISLLRLLLIYLPSHCTNWPLPLFIFSRQISLVLGGVLPLVMFVALHPIAKGQEVTISYGESWVKTFLAYQPQATLIFNQVCPLSMCTSYLPFTCLTSSPSLVRTDLHGPSRRRPEARTGPAR